MKKLLLTLAIITFATLPTLSNANVAKAGKAIGGATGLALNFAVDQLLNGIGWVMDEGTRSKKIPDTPSSGSSSSGDSGSTGTGTTTVPNPFHVDGEGGESGGIPSDAQTYPFEYWFDSKPFSSAESACAYYFGSYLPQQGYKKSRRPDGTYLERTNIYIGSSGYYHSSVPGYFSCTTHASHVSDKSCENHNFCGSTYSKTGMIAYKGTEKTTTTTVSDDYKERREKARQAVEQAIAQAQAQVNAQSSTTTAPTDATDNPRAGTNTGVGDLANPVGVDTGTGTNTGVGDLATPVHVDNTNTNTGDTTTNTNTNTTTTTTTTTNTHTNTKTETKPFEMPTFCGWASTVCDFMDWVKTEPQEPTKDTQIDIEPPPTLPQSVNIRFGGACPAPRNIPIVFATVNANLAISYDPICRFAELIAPIVKICSTLVALYILAGIKS